MRKYKLTQHLKELSEQNPEYANLYSTWNLNQRTCSDILKNVVLHYPHFSLHDASHAEAVLSKMEMVLGDRIQNLSPTDTWLLLHAAYAHDLGMVLEWERIETKWKEPDFQDWLADQEKSQDADLREAIAFVRKTHDLGKEADWPLEARRCVSLIDEALFRGKHAQMSKEYIEFVRPELGLDLGHNNLIQPRLVKLLGQICKLHTDPLDCVMKLDYETNGFNSDYAHPRFVAMMLRLGDLLDVDNGRFNKGALAAAGGLPETSKPHLEKHEATTHLLVTPQEIRFRSDCPNSEAYLEARRFVTWLENEVDFLTKNWALIMPEDLGGYAPRFDHKELLICGVPDIEGVAGLKFEISQDKAFQVIEGSNIYKDRFVFIREVIQNAMDASKLQLWKDLCARNYLAWEDPEHPLDEEKLKHLQPYDVKPEIYQNYPVEVKLSTPATGQVEIEVSDRGTGISVDAFKRMCNVGESNESSAQLKKTIREMPNWLRPTAGFGIGLQSIFLVADRFEIDTSTGQEAFHAVIHSRREGGYLQLQRADRVTPRGTTIRIRTNVINDVTYSIGRETDQYLTFYLDPLDPENHTSEVHVLEVIHKVCGVSMFPLRVTCQEQSMDDFNNRGHDEEMCDKTWSTWEDRYRYKLAEDWKTLLLWDTAEAVNTKFQFDRHGTYSLTTCFKGIKMVRNPLRITAQGFFVQMDLYGMDTRQTITLDRESLTEEGVQKVRDLYGAYLEVFKNIFLKEMKKKNWIIPETFDPYALWLCCSDRQRTSIPESIIEKMTDTVVCIVRDKDGTYVKQPKPVCELIKTIKDQWYLDIEKFRTLSVGQSPYHFKEICDMLDQNAKKEDTPDQPGRTYIADEKFKENEWSSHWHDQVQIVSGANNRHFLCYTFQDQQGTIQVPENQQYLFLRGLSEPILGCNYGIYYEDKENRRLKRYAIPALKGYETIAVKDMCYYIGYPNNLRAAWIVSPFTREDLEAYEKLKTSKEAFAEQILNAKTFSWVVDWVQKNHLGDTTPTQAEITHCYRKLIYAYCEALEKTDSDQAERESLQ